MSNITLDEMLPLLKREAFSRSGTLLAMFVGISLVFMVIGAGWQKNYTSYVQLYVDDRNLVGPLLNTARTANVSQVKLAKQELFANDIVDQVLAGVGLVDENTTPIEREELRDDLIKGTTVFNRSNQLLEIEFSDEDPKMAFETTSLLSELFLKKTMESTNVETTEAFEFIIDQVETYRSKLEDAEQRLEDFRNDNPGVSLEDGGAVTARIIDLQRDYEETSLLFAQENQTRKTLEAELRNESVTIARDYEVGRSNARINALLAEIEVLSLSYTEDYPDIIRLRQQIEDVKTQAQRTAQQRDGADNGQTTITVNGAAYSAPANLSPVYQQLRSEMLRAAAQAAALQSRLRQIDILIKKEIARSETSSKVERTLNDLTRDYEINQDIFEELLLKQESARITMTLGSEQQGVLYRIQQKASFPVRPNGLRFLHIVLLGLVLAATLPFVYLIVFLKLDPRIRTGSSVTDLLELPLLTVVPHMRSPRESVPYFRRPSAILATVAVVCGLYVVVYILKLAFETTATGGVI